VKHPLAQGPAMPCATCSEPAFAGGIWRASFTLAEAYRVPNRISNSLYLVLAQNECGITNKAGMCSYIYHDQKFLTMLLTSGCYISTFKCNSFICLGSAGEGASAITSRAAWFFGNAITSRILGSPEKIIHNRSMPGAIPP